jgi:hypothetical protein
VIAPPDIACGSIDGRHRKFRAENAPQPHADGCLRCSPSSPWALTQAHSIAVAICTAERGDTARVEELIAVGADLDAADASGRTPLLVAVANLHTAVARRNYRFNWGGPVVASY